MVDLSNRFPNTVDGREKAQETAGDDWAEHVDWWGDDDTSYARRQIIREAIRQGADVSPKLQNEVSNRSVQDIATLAGAGQTALRGIMGRIVNDAGHADIPDVVRTPDGIRSRLPA